MEVSSTKELFLRSAAGWESEYGVMCSATQDGLRVRRSKEDVRAFAGRRSATGPGKPYWKRPFGSTGGATAVTGLDMGTGTAGSGEVVDGVETVVLLVAMVGTGFSFLVL